MKAEVRKEKRFQARLLLGLLALALLTPLGVILPAAFKSGGAFGEWGPDYFERVLGYVPEGIRSASGLWHAPAAGYAFSKDTSLVAQLVFYVASGLLGLLLVGLAAALFARIVRRHGE